MPLLQHSVLICAAMNQLGTVYATKRRRRNSKSLKPPPKEGITKSNPSKRHRERLNAELDTLASLLPFEASILSKLDKLSILRLSVSYLRTKSYFQVAMYGKEPLRNDLSRTHDIPCLDAILDSDLILQALNGFLLILASEGEVFFASHTIESYLGFHQSDIVHQSVYELVHSEDREELQRQLMWNSFLPPDGANMTLQEVLLPENCQYLERSFTVRFRCLLDNTSGFLRLDIRGRIKVLHGQNRKTEEPPLALFAVCTPFGPPSLLEVPQKDVMFKSKHKLDMSLVSMDQRGKMLLGYSDSEMSNKGGYDLVHFDDLAYVANAHQELLKTGASGMIAYRVITKEGQWQWLQTSSRLVYKCSKPDFIICTHRPLMEEEGRDLLGKRTMDFKVSYLDATLTTSTYGSDNNEYSSNTRGQKGRRYKNQLRDILTTCRKRKVASGDYTEEAGYASGTYPYPTDNGIGSYVQPPNLPNLYSAAALDNSRFFSAEDYLQYRHLSNYYADYSHTAAAAAQYGMGNGFIDVSSRATCLPPHTSAPPPSYSDVNPLSKDDKLYACQLESAKYDDGGGGGVVPNAMDGPRLVAQGLAAVKAPLCCADTGSGYSDPTVAATTLKGCIVSAPLHGASSSSLQPLLSSLERDCKMATGVMPGDGSHIPAGMLGQGSRFHDERSSAVLRSLKTDDHKHHVSLSPSSSLHTLPASAPHLSSSGRHHHHHHHHHNHHNHQQHMADVGHSTTSPVIDAISSKPSILPSSYANNTRQTVLMWGSANTTRRSPVVSSTTTTTSLSTSPPMVSSTSVMHHPYVDKTNNVHYVDGHHHHHRQHHHNMGKQHGTVASSVNANDLHMSCKWGGGTTPPSSHQSTPPLPSSPHVITTTRVLTPATYCSSSYGSETVNSNELHHRGGASNGSLNNGGSNSSSGGGHDKHDGNPLLSISEVTNALLSHD